MTFCNITQSALPVNHGGECEKHTTLAPYEKSKSLGETTPKRNRAADVLLDWAEAHIKGASLTLTIKLARDWTSVFSKQRTSAKRH
jgi:hypothetical protein